jgi:hypothetical protein
MMFTNDSLVVTLVAVTLVTFYDSALPGCSRKDVTVCYSSLTRGGVVHVDVMCIVVAQ